MSKPITVLFKEQYHGVIAQNFYKWRKCSLHLWNNKLKKKLQMKESNFLKEFCIATTFVQNFQAPPSKKIIIITIKEIKHKRKKFPSQI